jgi:hypothetical protein
MRLREGKGEADVTARRIEHRAMGAVLQNAPMAKAGKNVRFRHRMLSPKRVRSILAFDDPPASPVKAIRALSLPWCADRAY